MRLILLLGFLHMALPVWADTSVPSSLISLGDGKFFSSTAIVVDKARRLLSIWESQNGTLSKVAEFPSDLGKYEGPKAARGDHRTPEGVYFLEQQLEGPSLNFQEYGVRAFTTNYPNLFDRRQGKTGNGIWLHAIPDQVSLERGSRGCVVVRNSAIMEISKHIRLKQTPIIIADTVGYQSQRELNSLAESIKRTVEDWRAAWESKQLDKYLSFYGDNFESLKMNKEQWKSYKSGLNEKYATISIKFSDPVVYEYKGQYILRILQQYKSDLHQDFGEKLLYLEKVGSDIRIVGEEWAPVENSEAIQALVTAQSGTAAN